MPVSDSDDEVGGGLVARTRQGDNAAPLTITELSNQLKRTVEDRFGHVRVRGEISGFKRVASGHCYLALKDDKARIEAVIWRGNFQKLRFRPEEGLEVLAHAFLEAVRLPAHAIRSRRGSLAAASGRMRFR